MKHLQNFDLFLESTKDNCKNCGSPAKSGAKECPYCASAYHEEPEEPTKSPKKKSSMKNMKNMKNMKMKQEK